MPELRRDPIVDRWVIIAENRAARPGALAAARAAEGLSATIAPCERDSAESPPRAHVEGVCPFCPGNERETPSEVFALRDGGGAPNTPGWRVRVVPNKFPALAPHGLTTDDQAAIAAPLLGLKGLYASAPAFGVHEVIVDTPRHVTEIGELSDDEFADSLAAIRARLQVIRKQSGLTQALVFKNVGRAGGATREHLHSQLMATGAAPELIGDELRGAKRFFDERRQCVFCRMIDDERACGQRIVAESSSFVVLCPFASRFAYEMWILPKKHSSHFELGGEEDLADLARLGRRAIAKIEQLFRPPAYNLVFHSAPFDSLAIEHYHWHIEVLPRLTIPAGFEWGSGCAVNPVSPEAATIALRTGLR